MINILAMIAIILGIIASLTGIIVIIIKGSKWFGATDVKIEQLCSDVKKQNGTDKSLEKRLHEKVEVSDCDKFQTTVSDQLNILVKHTLGDK